MRLHRATWEIVYFTVVAGKHLDVLPILWLIFTL